MAVQPFKGTSREFWDANGFAFDVRAQSGRWELREFVDQRPVQWMIASSVSLLAAEASVNPGPRGWVIVGHNSPAPAHQPFSNPIEAFQWWVGQEFKDELPELTVGTK